jgi:hypothetical protein
LTHTQLSVDTHPPVTDSEGALALVRGASTPQLRPHVSSYDNLPVHPSTASAIAIFTDGLHPLIVSRT